MEEKIKVYVPQSVYHVLAKDMELFEFFKKDGTLNRNDFLNTLIVNYYDSYQKDTKETYDHIRETLRENTKCSDLEIEDIASSIMGFVETRSNQLQGTKNEVTVSVKPTRYTKNVFRFIETHLIGNGTVSNYFRNLFASYVLFPQDRRERIIFRDKFAVIEEAISRKMKIWFTTSSNDTEHIASPYQIAGSREELFNYLLCVYRDVPRSYRICRMKQVVVLNESAEYPKDVLPYLEAMKKAPQFAYDAGKEIKEIRVRLTERGKDMFTKIYLLRPEPVRIEGNDYIFDCSGTQAFQYFQKFGRHAVVIEPKELGSQLRSFYAMGYRTYGRYYPKEEGNRDTKNE